MNSGGDEEREIRRVRYKAAKKLAKKTVAVAKSMTFNRLYHRLGTKKEEKEVFKLTRARKRKVRDLGVVRCIKNENGKILFEDADIKEIWQRYFFNLLNGEGMENSRSREREREDRRNDPRECGHISKDRRD